MTWEKCGCSSFTHYKLHMLQITTKPSSSTNNEIAHVNTYYNPSHYLQFEQLLLCNLSHTYYDVRCGNGVRVVVENKIG